MKKAIAVVAIFVTLATLGAPTFADARGWHGGGHGWHGGWWWPGAVIGGLVVGTAAVLTAPFYAAAAAVAPPPVVVAPPPTVYAPPPTVYVPAPAAVQREVVYPNGRYVLYGDGVSQPWQWVWIPAR